MTCANYVSGEGIVARLCTKSNMPTVQYRERSAAVAHSTNQPSDFRLNLECATAALRSRYCTDRSTLTKIRVFVQSLVAMEKSAGRTFISHESSAICHIDRVPGFHDHTIRLFVSFSASLCDPLALLCDASVYTTRMNFILDSERCERTAELVR